MLISKLSKQPTADIEEIREELAEQGYLRMRSFKEKEKTNKTRTRKICFFHWYPNFSWQKQ